MDLDGYNLNSLQILRGRKMLLELANGAVIGANVYDSIAMLLKLMHCPST